MIIRAPSPSVTNWSFANSAATTPIFTLNDNSGNNIVTMQPNIPATPLAANNIIYVAGQQPATLTTNVDSYVTHIRGWGQGSSTAAGQMVLRVHFPIGAGGETFTTNYTGSKLAAAINAQTDSTSSGITPVSGFVGNHGVIALATGIGAGWNVGVHGRGQKSTGANIGVLGSAISSASGEVWNIGVLGVARQASQISNSGYFYAGTIEPSTAPGASSVLAVDSAATAVNLVNLLFNGGNVAVVNSRGHWTLTPTATAGGVTTLSSTPGAHTAVTAEVIDYNYAAHTMTITGGYATQRFATFAQPTISAATSLTVTTAATVNIDGPPIAGGAGPAVITNNYALRVATGNLFLGGLVTTYNNIAVQGNGVPSLVKVGRPAQQTNSTVTLVTYTCPASDGSYEIQANINCTTVTTVTMTVTCSYTDEAGTARVLTLPFFLLAGTLVQSITTAQTAIAYSSMPITIRAKASTSITVATAGTVTSVVYTGEGIIKQIA